MTQSRSLPKPLWIFWCAFLALSLLTWLTQWRFSKNLIRYGYPYDSPFFVRYSYHFDLNCYTGRFQHFGTPQFFSPALGWPFTYPAPVALVYRFFYAFGTHAMAVFLTFSVLVYAAAALLLIAALVRRGIAPWQAALFTLPLAALAYPSALQMFLANLEVVVFLFVTLGLWAYVVGRNNLAAACFGIAGAMKIFPLAFLALVLRKPAALAVGILTAAVFTVAALFSFGPHPLQTLHSIRDGLAFFRVNYVNRFNHYESSMDHSWFSVLKLPLVRYGHITQFGHIYTASMVVLAVAGLLLWFLRVRHMPVPNQILFLSIFCVSAPPVSHDYTLTNLYFSFGLVTLLLLRQPRSRALHLALAVFALLFTAQNWMVFHRGAIPDLRFAGQFKAFLLLGLFLLSVAKPLGTPTPTESEQRTA